MAQSPMETCVFMYNDAKDSAASFCSKLLGAASSMQTFCWRALEGRHHAS